MSADDSETPKLLVTAFMVVVAAVLVLGSAMAWLTMRRFDAIEERFQRLSLQEFRLMRGLRSRANQLHSAALRFVVTLDAVHLERFTEYQRDLDDYLTTQVPELIQHPLFKDFQARWEGYMNDAASSMETASAGRDPKDVVSDLLGSVESVRLVLDQIGELVSDVSEERIDDLRRDLQSYHASVSDLQLTLFASLALLVLSAGVLWWLAGRAFLSPLKADLTEARQHAEDKEELAQIGAMAAAVVHEIRNPITTIRARIFALSGLLENDTAARKQADIIEEQIDRLEKMSEEFLAFGRPSEPKFEEVSIKVFLNEIKEAMEPQVAAAGGRLSLEAIEDARVLMDVSQIEQVLTNVIRNGAEAMSPPDGEVRLSSTRLPEHVRISVSDNGPGIAEEMLPDLFTPFKTGKQGGIGLGLSVAKKLVDIHGGKLKIENAPGQGAVFHIELPRLQ